MQDVITLENIVASLPKEQILALAAEALRAKARGQVTGSTNDFAAPFAAPFEHSYEVKPGSLTKKIKARWSRAKAKAKAKAKATARAPKAATKAKRGATGQKRTTEQLAAVKEQIRTHIESHPQSSSEQIKAALKLGKAELALPLRQLVADGFVQTEGQKRATRYSVSGQAAPKKTRRMNGASKALTEAPAQA